MSDITPVRVGLIGCGNISSVYLGNARRLRSIEIVALADRLPQRAEQRAREFDIGRVCTVDELLADDQIELVLNLTTPEAHGPLGLRALEAGKAVYNEKPLAIALADGRRMVALAQQRALVLGCAPDTFLGGAWQQARELVDAGAIGEVVAGVMFMPSHGPESWHPDPEFYYRPGGGPLLDMGPYYLTVLVSLLGPVRRAVGMARASFPTRTITSRPRAGQRIDVQVPTHVAGVLELAGGAIVTLLTSFDIWHANLPPIELYGADGSLGLPDPNGFGGRVRLRKADDEQWQTIDPRPRYLDNWRGLGPADAARALRSGRRPRADGTLALHVLEVMHAILQASESGRCIELTTTCDRPAPLEEQEEL